MATSEWHIQIRGLHGPLPVPVVVQSISKGRLARRDGGGGVSSCLFVLPGRQQIRVKVRLLAATAFIISNVLQLLV
jgi:hypothetical protein